MTAICGGGTSAIKPVGVAASQILSPDALATLFEGGGFAWLSTLVYALGYLTFDLTQICATDPPALPNVDSARFVSYLASPQGAQFLREDATTIAEYLLWYLYCECTSAPTPAPPAPPTMPTGVQVDTPPATSTGTSPCGYGGQIFGTYSYDANGNYQVPLGASTGNVTASRWYQLTHNTTLNDGTSDTPTPTTLTLQQLNASNAIVQQDVYTHPALQSGIQRVYSGQLAPGVTHFGLLLHAPTPATGQFRQYDSMVLYCTAPPSAVMQACCPPDPYLQVLINQVLQLEQLILESLPQGKVPYVDGVKHANLSGTGTVALTAQAVAIRVDIVSRPDPWPSHPGTPPYLYSLGFITPYAVGTPLRGSRLVYDHQIYEYPSYTDQIGWGLADQVVVNIVELQKASTPVSSLAAS
jgi:hypothetical protein